MRAIGSAEGNTKREKRCVAKMVGVEVEGIVAFILAVMCRWMYAGCCESGFSSEVPTGRL